MWYEYHLLLSQPLFGKKMSFEDRVKEACNEYEVPGVVLAADGPGLCIFFLYSRRKSMGADNRQAKRISKGHLAHAC
jgi:hypothetical protein